MGNRRKPRAALVPCQVFPGMFPGEYLALLEAINPRNGTERITVRVLVDEENIEIAGEEPTREKPTDARLKVFIVDEKEGYVLAVLPQPGEPVGDSIVLPEDELVMA